MMLIVHLDPLRDNLITRTQNSNPLTGLWEPFLRNAKDGSLQIYYSRENSRSSQYSILRISQDGGSTWDAARIVSGAGINARDGMIGGASFDDDGVEKLI